MYYQCSKDQTHQSEDADYCSVCGAKIVGTPSAISSASAPVTAPAQASASGAETCPDCGLARRPGARFCEVCRYNFDTRTSGAIGGITPTAAAPTGAVLQAPDPPTTPAAPPIVSTVADAAPSIGTPVQVDGSAPLSMIWEALVQVDPSLYTDPDPSAPCPVGDPERTFPLDLPESLIGRRSDRLDIHPELPLTDPGVSHRHAKIYRLPDGTLAFLDVGSTNGSGINGTEAAAGVKIPLRNGDQITVGCWTRITIRLVG